MGEPKNNRLLTVDLFKFIASLFVILIHCTFYGGLGMSVKAIGRFAVPFFFLCTGYFLYGNTPDKLLKKLRHIVGLAFFSFVFYFFFFAILNFAQAGTNGLIEFALSFINLEKIIRFLAFNVPFSFTNLWYLFALVYVYLIFYCLIKSKLSEKLIFAIAFAVLLMHLFLWQMNLSFDITKNTFYVRNFLFFGFPMVTAGAFIKKHQHKIPKINNATMVLLLVAGATLSVWSRWLIGNKSLPLGAVIMSVSLLIYAIQTKWDSDHSFLRKAGTYSTYIYIFHPCTIDLVRLLAKKIGISDQSPLWINAMPIVVCMITILVAMVYCAVKPKIPLLFNRMKGKASQKNYVK